MAGPTKQISEMICYHIQRGAPYEQASLLAGINPHTTRAWRKRGRWDIENEIESEYAKFVMDEETSKAQYFQSLVNVVTAKAETDWVAAMTILERRDPSSWGKNNYKSEMNVADGTYKGQHEAIMKKMNEGSMSANEALQRSQVLLNGARLSEVSEFQKELDEIKNKLGEQNERRDNQKS